MAIKDAEVDYIDKKTKTIHLKDGRSEPLSEEAAYSLFESKGAKDIRTGAKQAERDLANSTSPEGYTMLRKFGNSILPKVVNEYVVNPSFAAGRALETREGQEDMGFFGRMYENLEARNRGAREGLSELEEENPYSALAGSGLGIAGDLMTPLPKGRPVLGGAAFGAAAGEKPIYEDPTGALKNAGLGAGIGYGVGKLQNVANQRKALRQHPENVQRVGELNKDAQRAYGQAIETKLSGLDKNLPSGGVGKGALNIPGFVNAEINVSPIAGSSQANSMIKFFETMEKGLPTKIREADVKKIYNVIESKMATATAEELPYLNRFREHIVEVLPLRIGQAVATEKVLPKIIRNYQKSLSKTLDTFLNDAPVVKMLSENPNNKKIIQNLKQNLFKNVEMINQMPPEVIAEAIQNGSLNQILAKGITGSKDYASLVQEMQAVSGQLSKLGSNAASTPMGKAYAKAADHLQKIKTDAVSAANQAIGSPMDFSLVMNEAAEKAASKISNAVGVKNPFISKSIAPSNARPVPMDMPQAPQVGKLAQSFENPNYYKDKVKGMASLKGGLGGALAANVLGMGNAAAGGAGIAGLASVMRGATRPDALGSFNRNFIQKGGVSGIVHAISQKASYTNGILLDPQDRRDVVAEIENDPDIPLGDKAVLQAKVNRGLSLEKMLQQYGM